MVNRKEKQLQEFKELINRDWQLSLDEDEFLDSVLNLLLSRETKKAAEIVNFFYSEEWESLLELIPEYPIKNYAEFHYDMVEEDDIIEKKLCEFDDEEVLEECDERGLSKIESADIVTEMNLSEMTDLFLSFSPQKQLEIVKLLQDV